MAVPSVATYSAQALIDAQQAFLDLIDAGSGAGSTKIRDSGDVLLAQIPMDDPAGTIDGAGQLTITYSGPDTSANATGTAAYGELCDSDDNVILALPAEAGVVAVAGKIVLNVLAITSGSPVYVVSTTIG